MDHFFLLLSKQVLQFTNFPKRKGLQVLAWVYGFHFYQRTPSFLIPFLIIPSDAFGVTSIYLLLNTLIKILKFPLSIPVATNWVYILGICAGFSLSRDLLHLGISIV
jgi:hypothetical protein